MNRRLPWLVAAALLLLAGAARAQIPDHMKCYKIKDPLKLKGVADLEGKQFGLEKSCKIGPAKFFCVPVEKRVQEAVDAGTGLPITLLPITNGPQPGDEICYAIRCPQPFPADQDVTDQFGRRTVSKLIPSLLCVPAVKGGPPPTLPCAQTAPQCNGPCPDPNQKCTAIPGATACQCVSLLDCGQTFPQCNGACPAAAPQCLPVTDPLGGATPFCRCK